MRKETDQPTRNGVWPAKNRRFALITGGVVCATLILSALILFVIIEGGHFGFAGKLSAPFYFALASREGDNKQYDKAIADYTKAIELDSNYADAYCNRGSVYNTLQQYEKAVADYTKAIELVHCFI
jgi:tetratricopeptide (TPR) repeat protein